MTKVFFFSWKSNALVRLLSVQRSMSLFWIMLLFFSANAYSQSNRYLSGTVFDESNLPFTGVNVTVKNSSTGVVTDNKGRFRISIGQEELPITLLFNFVGYSTSEIDVYENQPIKVNLTPKLNKLDVIVVSASRKSEALSNVPITVETLTANELKQSPAVSFYDVISSIKGVNTLNTSIAFTVYNTRGFQHPTNQRFVQLVDGADNASPELGLPIANTIGPGELDVQSVELIPGASSAIYGLSASNGLLNLITKDPFTYQGLSISLKSGVNNINSPFKKIYNIDATPYQNIALRFAKAWNNKIAFKVNFGYLKGEDWASGDFNDYRDWNGLGFNNRNDPGYDGANLYGDEGGATNILTLGNIPTKVSRTGYTENDLTDYETKLLHADATLVYKFTNDKVLSYTYRVGQVDNVFTRGNKLKFKDFLVQQHVLDFKTPELTFRTYVNTENSGDSYNIRYLADALNTAVKTNKQWNTDFTTGYNQAVSLGQTREQAFISAREFADEGRLIPGSAEFNNVANKVKKDGSWTTGANFVAKGYLTHTELNYNFSKYTQKIADVLVGVDYRYSQVKSDGTFYPDTVNSDAVYNYKAGGFIQASRNLTDKILLSASIRGDKARALDFELTERIGLIYSLNKEHNFRISFQNGYRMPSFYEAAQYLVTGAGIGVGGLKPFSEPSQIIHNSYDFYSVQEFADQFKAKYVELLTSGVPQAQASAQALVQSKDVLKVSTFDYLKPEQNKTIDFSYKGAFLSNKLYVDLNVYGTQYNDFIQTYTVIKPTGGVSNTTVDAQKILGGQYVAYQTFSNVPTSVYVYGGSLGVDFNFYKKYILSGNVNYVELDWGKTSKDALSNGFNTPNYNVYLSLSNSNFHKNIGFKLAYKWTSKTDWKTDFSIGKVPAWSTVDAQVSYAIPQYKAIVSFGGTNVFNKYYTQYIGGPSIGGFYYASISFDGLFNQ